jgi:hypothetical protein
MPFIDQPEDEYQDSLTYREVPGDHTDQDGNYIPDFGPHGECDIPANQRGEYKKFFDAALKVQQGLQELVEKHGLELIQDGDAIRLVDKNKHWMTDVW